jgi:hypothetical protein
MTGEKQLENVECFNYVGSSVNEARCACEIKSRIVTTKAAFKRMKTLYQQIGHKFKEEISKGLHLEHSFVSC